MESILDDLQLQVEDIELTEEKETPLYLAIAGLKQVRGNLNYACTVIFLFINSRRDIFCPTKVRDLLLHKLPFSGELPDYDELTSK